MKLSKPSIEDDVEDDVPSEVVIVDEDFEGALEWLEIDDDERCPMKKPFRFDDTF